MGLLRDYEPSCGPSCEALLPGQLGHASAELLPPPLVELDPLAGVAHRGELQQRPEHHPEAEGQVDVQRLHVGDLGQGPGREEDCHKLLPVLVSDLLTEPMRVTMVSTVVPPSPTLAGAEPRGR